MTTRIAHGVGANLLGQHSAERNQEATVCVGNLNDQFSEELLWELFVQAGPVGFTFIGRFYSAMALEQHSSHSQTVIEPSSIIIHHLQA